MSNIEQNTKDILELNKLIYGNMTTQSEMMHQMDDNISKLGTKFIQSHKDIKDSHQKISQYNEVLTDLLDKNKAIDDKVKNQIDIQNSITKEVEKSKDYFANVIDVINKATHKNTESNQELIELISQSNDEYTRIMIDVNNALSKTSDNIVNATNTDKLIQFSNQIDNITTRVENLVLNTAQQNTDRQNKLDSLIGIMDKVVTMIDTTNDVQSVLADQLSDINSKLSTVKVKVDVLYEAQHLDDVSEPIDTISDIPKVGDENE